MVLQNYRFKCANEKCGHEFLKRYTVEEFDKTQYTTGFGCFDCGFPKMGVIKSMATIKDSFTPGWQPNIRKHCNTYSEYKQHLKNMKLVEFGYEEIPEYEDKTPFWTPEMLKSLYKHGVEIGTALERDLLSRSASERDANL